MTFEEALEAELKTISGLANSVYPLVAPKDVSPFLVYRKENIDYKRVLNGAVVKTEATYSLVVVSGGYAALQTLSIAVIDKVLSFLHRAIGTGGPSIEDVTIRHLGDTFDETIEKARADLQIRIKY